MAHSLFDGLLPLIYTRRPMPKVTLRWNVFVALLLSILVAVGYALILRVPFLLDDYPFVRLIAPPKGTPSSGVYWAHILSEFYKDFQPAVYRPLHWLSFGIDYTLYGVNPLGYHVTNLILHAISAFFVYLVALELLPGERRWPPAITAGAIFALYPTSPGAVTWIVGRIDVICAVFLLPALLFFLRWLRTERRLHLIVSVGLYFLAMLGKETATVLPGMLFLCALYKGRDLRSAAFSMVPFAVALGVYLAIREHFVAGTGTNYVSAMPLDLPSNLQGFLYCTLRMVFPLNLSLLPHPNRWERFLIPVFSFWPVVVIGAYFLGRAREKLPILLLAFYALAAVPVFNALSPDPELGYGRWFYIPSAFMSMLIAYLLWAAFPKHKRLSLAATIVVCAYFLAILVANNSVYVKAGEMANELLATGETPAEFPVYYKGVNIFDEGSWNQANSPLFKKG